MKLPKELILKNFQAPGDILMLTRAIAELKREYPKLKIKVNTCANEFFENNPNIYSDESEIRLFNTSDPDLQNRYSVEDDWLEVIAHYGDNEQYGEQVDNPWSINKCGSTKKHYANGMIGYLNAFFGLNIKPKDITPDLYLTSKEKEPLLDLPDKYWVVVCGGKGDYTRKIYPERKWNELFDLMPHTNFVQMGITACNHKHPTFSKPNVVNYLNRTTLRQSLTLIYNSVGVISPITYAHLASAALDKPCIVLAGGGEHHTWQAYPGQHFLHTCGQSFSYSRLPESIKTEVQPENIKNPDCCLSGGCWESACQNLMVDGEQLCMKFITPEYIADIINKISGKGN